MRIKVTAIFNAENIFNNLKYIAYYYISSTFTRILSEYYLLFQFVVILDTLDTLDLHVRFYVHFSTWFQIFENSFKYIYSRSTFSFQFSISIQIGKRFYYNI